MDANDILLGFVAVPDHTIAIDGKISQSKALASGPTRRHWRSYGDAPLPTPAEALDEPFSAFPSWFLRITCDRCGKVVMHNEAHMTDRQRGIVLRVLLNRMRHDGCGGLPAKAELLTGVAGTSSRPVRRLG
jgi:hypothetical protein